MLRKQKSVALLGLGAILLLPTGFNPVSRAAFGAANSQPVPVATFYDPDGVVGDNFGATVALSADGSEALIGAASASESSISDVGKVYIYSRINGVWSINPTATFIDSSLQAEDGFGGNLTLSADGTTALITSTGAGIVYIYNRTNGIWPAMPSAVLHDPGSANSGITGDCFGCGITVSADGSAALVGAEDAGVNGVSGAGEVYVFTRTNGAWSETPTAVFTDSRNVKDDSFGNSVALSADGSIALVGTASLFNPGRAFIFTKKSDVWNTNPVSVFDISGNNDQIASSVGLSADGGVALIGSPGADSGLGAVYVYTATNGVWSPTPAAVFNDPPSQGAFGNGVALSGNGAVAAVSGGNVYIFVQENGSWSPSAVTVLTAQPPDSNFNGFYGFAGVAMSSDGSEALIGDPEMPGLVVPPPPPGSINGAVGRAFIYESSNNWIPPNPAPPPSGSSGGGSFGWLSVILIFGLMLCPRDWR